MNKSKVIIITIITTILSIIYSILSYIGITRFLWLHLCSSKNLIEKYNNLPKANKKQKVVISFTTTPQNIKKIKPMINSILDQTVKVDLIILVSPEKYKFNEFSNYIKNVAYIIPSANNYGKWTNIIPVLLREPDCNTTIIALNDNIIYGNDFIFTILEESKKYPNSTLIDKNNKFILTKPSCLNCNNMNLDKNNFDNNWLINNTKNYNFINYNENYKIIVFP